MNTHKWKWYWSWMGLYFLAVLSAHANEAEKSLLPLKRDLARATVEYGRAIEACPLARTFSSKLLAELQRIELADDVLLRALGWLATKRRLACEKEARNALADALLSLRQARLDLELDTAGVDHVIASLWGTALRESALRSEYEQLPAAVRSRLESFPELAVPFDALKLHEMLVAAKSAANKKPGPD